MNLKTSFWLVFLCLVRKGGVVSYLATFYCYFDMKEFKVMRLVKETPTSAFGVIFLSEDQRGLNHKPICRL